MQQFTTLPRPAGARIVAAGAWLKNAAARLDGGRLRWSEVHGDLGETAHRAALERSMSRLLDVGGVDAIAHDLHPDFFSTHLAQALAAELGVPAVPVQHHHAHIAAVQAEHGLETPVIGLALDGVGLGTDGTAWGGELLRVHGAQWERLGHLRHLRLPGGDVAAREPWRLVAGLLHEMGRDSEMESRLAPFVNSARAASLRSMLDRDVNCPVTSSTGRWFDAAAGVLRLCLRQEHEAEAAMALEAAAAQWLRAHHVAPDPALVPGLADGRLDMHPLMELLLSLSVSESADAAPHGAALFHVNLADGLARWAAHAAKRQGIDTVALGGGCFFNRILRERVEQGLRAAGLRVFRPVTVNCGDAGLALGQAWVAADRMRLDASVHSQNQEAALCA